MTADKWNDLTPEQRREANELLRQAQFEEFENYLNICQLEDLKRKETEKNELLQS